MKGPSRRVSEAFTKWDGVCEMKKKNMGGGLNRCGVTVGLFATLSKISQGFYGFAKIFTGHFRRAFLQGCEIFAMFS